MNHTPHPPKPKYHPLSRIFFVEKYHSTLVASTLIILFSEMSKKFTQNNSKQQKFVKESFEFQRNILFVKIKFSKLINQHKVASKVL
jgi:uncharacterized membrane protein